MAKQISTCKLSEKYLFTQKHSSRKRLHIYQYIFRQNQLPLNLFKADQNEPTNAIFVSISWLCYLSEVSK